MKKYFLQTIGIPTVNGRLYSKENVQEVIYKYFKENDYLPVFYTGTNHTNLTLDFNPFIGKVYPDMFSIEDNAIYVFLSDDIINYSNGIKPIIQWQGVIDGIYTKVEKLMSINIINLITISKG